MAAGGATAALSEDEQHVNLLGILTQSITTSVFQEFLKEHSVALYAELHAKLRHAPGHELQVTHSRDEQNDSLPVIEVNVVYDYDYDVYDCIRVQWGRILWAVVLDAIGDFAWLGGDDTPERRLLQRATDHRAPVVMNDAYLAEAAQRFAMSEGRIRPPPYTRRRDVAVVRWEDWGAWEACSADAAAVPTLRTQALKSNTDTSHAHLPIEAIHGAMQKRAKGSLRGDCGAALEDITAAVERITRFHVGKALCERLVDALPAAVAANPEQQAAHAEAAEALAAAEAEGDSAEGIQLMGAALDAAKHAMSLHGLGPQAQLQAICPRRPPDDVEVLTRELTEVLGPNAFHVFSRFTNTARTRSAAQFLHFHMQMVQLVLGDPEHPEHWSRRMHRPVWEALYDVIVAANPDMKRYFPDEVGRAGGGEGGGAAAGEGGAAEADAAADAVETFQVAPEQPPLQTKSTDAAAFGALTGRCSMMQAAPVTGAALPTHLRTLPHPLAVRAALGLPATTAVLRDQYASTALQHAPRPVFGAAGFALGGVLYMQGGRAQELAGEVLAKPLRLGTVLAKFDASVRIILRKMGFSVVGHLYDAAVQPLPIAPMLQAAAARAQLDTMERHMVQDVLDWYAQGTQGPLRNNFRARELVDAIGQLQTVGHLTTYTQSEVYMLTPNGSHFAYVSEQMDPLLSEQGRGELDRLVRSARNHGAAAEWVRVPAKNELPALCDHTAVPIPSREDARVVLLDSAGSTQLHVLRVSGGAVGSTSPETAQMPRALKGASAVKLRGEDTVLVYGGVPLKKVLDRSEWEEAVVLHQRPNRQRPHLHEHPGPWVPPECDMFLVESRFGREGVFPVPNAARDVVGSRPRAALGGHGAVMLRGGNMVVWGGYTESGSFNPNVYVATLLDCKAACGTAVVPGECSQFRVAWSKALTAEGSAAPPSPRKSFFMHSVPASDAFLVFGGEVRGGASGGDLFTCALTSAPNGGANPAWADVQDRLQHMPTHMDELVTFFKVSWTKVPILEASSGGHKQVKGGAKTGAGGGAAPAPWMAPRHSAAVALLGRRIVMHGGLYSTGKKGVEGSDAADPMQGRLLETDFSTRVMSKAYQGGAGGVRTSGGAGVHTWGVLRPTRAAGYGVLRADTQVVKLGGEGVSLAPSSFLEDMHWLWAGIAHAACVNTGASTGAGEVTQWSIEAGAGEAGAAATAATLGGGAAPPVPPQPKSGSPALDAMTSSGRDDSGLCSAMVADMVLLCAPPVGETGNTGVPLAAHKCVLAAAVPWFADAVAKAANPPTPALHDDDVDGGVIPPPPPAAVPMTATAPPAAAEKPPHGGDSGHESEDDDAGDVVAPPPLERAPSLTLKRSMSVGPLSGAGRGDGDSAGSVSKPQLATPRHSAARPLVLSLPFAPVDAMQHVLLWVYTGRADVPRALVPAVWMLCQVLGLSPISRRVMQRVRAAAAKDKKAGRKPRANGLPASFFVEHKDVKWNEEGLFRAGRSLLGTPDMEHSQFVFAQCPLPLANLDTQLARHCGNQLNTKALLTTATDSPQALVASSSVTITPGPRQGNPRTAAALQWLLNESEHTDVFVQTRVPAVQGDGQEGGELSDVLSDTPPRECWQAAHSAVLAARSKLWRGQLCSEHFQPRSGAGQPREVSLGAEEDQPLSLEESGAMLQFVYGDVTGAVGADIAPQLLPLASLHSLHRLSTVCERAIVSGYDLDDLQSALGIYAFGLTMGSAGDRLCRIAAAAIVDAAPAPAVLRSAVQQLQEQGWFSAAAASKLLKQVGL